MSLAPLLVSTPFEREKTLMNPQPSQQRAAEVIRALTLAILFWVATSADLVNQRLRSRARGFGSRFSVQNEPMPSFAAKIVNVKKSIVGRAASAIVPLGDRRRHRLAPTQSESNVARRDQKIHTALALLLALRAERPGNR